MLYFSTLISTQIQDKQKLIFLQAFIFGLQNRGSAEHTPGSGVNIWPASAACCLFVLSVMITTVMIKREEINLEPFYLFIHLFIHKWSKTEKQEESKLHCQHGGQKMNSNSLHVSSMSCCTISHKGQTLKLAWWGLQSCI